MTVYIDLEAILELHAEILSVTEGSERLRDEKVLISALANPQRSFAGQELYPTLEEKAAILLFSLVQNHPFVDGNKRVGHGATELFLRENQKTIRATQDELESLILNIASSQMTQEALVEWLRDRIVDRPDTEN